MGTDEPSKKPFGLGVSKEFLVAFCSLIFAAGMNYMKLNDVEASVAELKKAFLDEQKDFNEVNMAEKLLENRVLSLEQKNQTSTQLHK